jgi:hypothetical protein
LVVILATGEIKKVYKAIMNLKHLNPRQTGSYDSPSHEVHNKLVKEEELFSIKKTAEFHGDSVIRLFVVEWQMQSSDADIYCEKSVRILETSPYLH